LSGIAGAVSKTAGFFILDSVKIACDGRKAQPCYDLPGAKTERCLMVRVLRAAEPTPVASASTIRYFTHKTASFLAVLCFLHLASQGQIAHWGQQSCLRPCCEPQNRTPHRFRDHARHLACASASLIAKRALVRTDGLFGHHRGFRCRRWLHQSGVRSAELKQSPPLRWTRAADAACCASTPPYTAPAPTPPWSKAAQPDRGSGTSPDSCSREFALTAHL
jgi:hypothetical protein